MFATISALLVGSGNEGESNNQRRIVVSKRLGRCLFQIDIKY